MDKNDIKYSNENIKQFVISKLDNLLKMNNETLSDKIQNIFKDTGEFFDLDRMTFYYYDQSTNTIHLIFEWCHLGVEPRQTKKYQIHENDLFFEQFIKNKNIIFEDVSKLDLNDSWLSYLISDHIKAFLGVPLYSKDSLLGYISLENQRRPQSFSSFYEQCFSLFFQALALRLSYENIMQDIKQHEEQSKLLTTNKYTFFSNVSHEVRTPLNGIHNALYLLQTTDLTKEQKNYLDMAQTSVDGISSIVERILDLEALESGNLDVQLRPFNIEDEMIRLIRLYQRQIEQKKLSLIFEYDYQIKNEVIGDERKLRHILSHILNNAVKFTEQGEIKFSVQKKSEDSYHFQIKDTGIGISKENIENLYDAFFQINMTDQKEFQGLGIGLTVASELTKLLKGRISVQSELNVGTTMTVELKFPPSKPLSYKETASLSVLIFSNGNPSLIKPLFESLELNLYDESNIDNNKVDVIIFEAPIRLNETIIQFKELYGHDDCMTYSIGQMNEKRMHKVDGVIEYPVSRTTMVQKLMSNYHKARKTVTSPYTKQLSGTALIVDDNRLNRVALEGILLKLGIKSKLADSGSKAIEMVKNESFDLILMDIQMPIMDGIEATRRIRSLGNSYQMIPIVAVTANSYFNDYDMLKASQINDVIFKPIKIESLGQLLRKYLSGTDTITIPQEILSFDRLDFLKRFEGSYDIAKEVVATFQAEYSKDLDHIKEAIVSKNNEDIVKTAHYYKGSCAYLSGKRLVWVLNRMMDLAKNHQLDEMKELLHLLIIETDELVKQLKSMKIIN